MFPLLLLLELGSRVALELGVFRIREAVVGCVRLEEPVAQAEHTIIALEKLVVKVVVQ